MDRYNKEQTKQYTHTHTSTLHTQQMVASTWLGDHQGRPSAPTDRLHKLRMARYQVHQLPIYNFTNDFVNDKFHWKQTRVPKIL